MEFALQFHRIEGCLEVMEYAIWFHRIEICTRKLRQFRSIPYSCYILDAYKYMEDIQEFKIYFCIHVTKCLLQNCKIIIKSILLWTKGKQNYFSVCGKFWI